MLVTEEHNPDGKDTRYAAEYGLNADGTNSKVYCYYKGLMWHLLRQRVIKHMYVDKLNFAGVTRPHITEHVIVQLNCKPLRISLFWKYKEPLRNDRHKVTAYVTSHQIEFASDDLTSEDVMAWLKTLDAARQKEDSSKQLLGRRLIEARRSHHNATLRSTGALDGGFEDPPTSPPESFPRCGKTSTTCATASAARACACCFTARREQERPRSCDGSTTPSGVTYASWRPRMLRVWTISTRSSPPPALSRSKTKTTRCTQCP